ncbi:immunoglobulin A1 protease, partial [Colletotrichum musicola]
MSRKPFLALLWALALAQALPDLAQSNGFSQFWNSSISPPLPTCVDGTGLCSLPAPVTPTPNSPTIPSLNSTVRFRSPTWQQYYNIGSPKHNSDCIVVHQYLRASSREQYHYIGEGKHNSDRFIASQHLGAPPWQQHHDARDNRCSIGDKFPNYESTCHCDSNHHKRQYHATVDPRRRTQDPATTSSFSIPGPIIHPPGTTQDPAPTSSFSIPGPVVPPPGRGSTGDGSPGVTATDPNLPGASTTTVNSTTEAPPIITEPPPGAVNPDLRHANSTCVRPVIIPFKGPPVICFKCFPKFPPNIAIKTPQFCIQLFGIKIGNCPPGSEKDPGGGGGGDGGDKPEDDPDEPDKSEEKSTASSTSSCTVTVTATHQTIFCSVTRAVTEGTREGTTVSTTCITSAYTTVTG